MKAFSAELSHVLLNSQSHIFMIDFNAISTYTSFSISFFMIFFYLYIIIFTLKSKLILKNTLLTPFPVIK